MASGDEKLAPKNEWDMSGLLRRERRPWVPLSSHETAAAAEYEQQKLGTATTANEPMAALSVNINEYALPKLWMLWARLADDGRVGNGSYILPAAVAWALADQWLGSSARGASVFSAGLMSLILTGVIRSSCVQMSGACVRSRMQLARRTCLL